MLKPWFVVRTKSRHEKVVETNLREKNILCYLPKRIEIRRGNAAPAKTERPMFAGYVFVQPESHQLYDLKYIRGSCGLVTFNQRPAIMQDWEVERIRRIAESDTAFETHSNLLVGERVVVVSGPLAGVEGELACFKNQKRLIINSYILGQCISLDIGLENISKASARVAG